MNKISLKPIRGFGDITLVIDGKYIAYRTQYSATGDLSYNDMSTGLFYGFFNTLRKLAYKFMPVNTVIMWDVTPLNDNVRKKAFDGYKNRDNWDKLSEEDRQKKIEFKDLYDELRALCTLLGFATYELYGYEADDLIALWCQQYPFGKNLVVTKDEDMYQLIDGTTTVYDVEKNTMKHTKWFKRKYGYGPENWSTYKAIAGCKSDTVPGIKGVGDVGATNYINGAAENSLVERIENEMDTWHKLVVLPHPTLKNYRLPFKKTNISYQTFFDFCQQNGFRSFIDKYWGDFQWFSNEKF